MNEGKLKKLWDARNACRAADDTYNAARDAARDSPSDATIAAHKDARIACVAAHDAVDAAWVAE